MVKTLVIGDCHVTNGQDLIRFKALSNYCVEKLPNNIIFIGDFLTLNCLSDWDRDKRKTMEGRRYSLELNAGNTALDLFQKSIKSKKGYDPNLIYIFGNHEDRLNRYLDKDPTFQDTVSIDKDLHLIKRKFKSVLYKEHIEIKGVTFTHIPISTNGKPLTGSNVSRKALQLYQKSCCFGHTHKLQVENLYRHGSKHLQQVLNVGCFFENDEEYVKGAPMNYWKGLCLLYQYGNQRFDLETISLSRLKKEYL